MVVVSVGKCPYARFVLYDYSIPHEYVRRQVTVFADSNCVTIVDGPKQLVKHKRCFEKLRQIEIPEHIKALEEQKKKAKKGSGMNRLTSAAPSAREFFKVAAEKGHAMGGMTAKLLDLMDLYGPVETEVTFCFTLSETTLPPNFMRIWTVANSPIKLVKKAKGESRRTSKWCRMQCSAPD